MRFTHQGDCQLELAEARGVGDHVDLGDFPACGREIEYEDQPIMPGQDDSYGAVHESSSCSLGTSRELPGRGRGALHDGSNLVEGYGEDVVQHEREELALTEAATRLADWADPVPDEIWDEATRHYDEQGLAAIILMIATTNLFNRLNATTKQVAGTQWKN